MDTLDPWIMIRIVRLPPRSSTKPARVVRTSRTTTVMISENDDPCYHYHSVP